MEEEKTRRLSKVQLIRLWVCLSRRKRQAIRIQNRPKRKDKKGGRSRGFSLSTRRDVLRRDGYRCAKCGRNTRLTLHHVVLMRDGGSGRLDNLTTLCEPCHQREHAVHSVRVDM